MWRETVDTLTGKCFRFGCVLCRGHTFDCKAASYEPRIAILGIWGDTWLTRGKYGIYVAAYVVVTGPLRGLRDAFWKVPREISKCDHVVHCHGKSALSTVVSPTSLAVTRIPSLVLRNMWHYGAENFDFLNMSYVAHTRRLYAKVWQHWHKNLTVVT